ncbi:MAG TPA: hypothetical protein DCM73_09375 [Clostridiales bacterium]|nr:hypothetical protein [Clostridiales bacterium]
MINIRILGFTEVWRLHVTAQVSMDISTGYINSEPEKLDVQAKIKNSRTIVPLRFVAESFNADVEWDEEARAVRITTK